MILGIDFGTSNSCCSYFSGKENRVITNEYGNEIYPTCIAFNKYSDEILYSNSAYDLTSNKDVTVIKNIKGLIGSPSDETDIEGTDIDVMYNNNLKKFTINEIVVLYLNYLKNTISIRFKLLLLIMLSLAFVAHYFMRDKLDLLK